MVYMHRNSYTLLSLFSIGDGVSDGGTCSIDAGPSTSHGASIDADPSTSHGASIDVDPSTSHGASIDVEASTSHGASTDADLLYASLIPDGFLYSSDSEDEVLLAVKDPQVFETKTSLSLQEILEQLASKINNDRISKFNISRSNLWEGALRGLKRKSFSPDSKVSVKFTDDSGTSEGAVDLGGPKREFFTLVIEWIVNSQLFCGTEKSKFLSCNANYLANDFFFYAGEFIAMSIVHGGPGPRCFGLPLYDSLIKGVSQASVSVNDVYDVDLRNSLQALKNAKTIQEAEQLVSDVNLEKVLELAGTHQILRKQEDVLNLVDKTAHWFVLDRVHAAYEQFKAGLSKLGVLGAMIENYDKLKEVFCYSEITLTAELFGCLFSVHQSEGGSNNRQVEGLVLSRWNDFLQDVEEKAVGITFSDILFFVSGVREVPPGGIELHVDFLHAPEQHGSKSRFPKANACACELMLPVVHQTYDEFKKDVTFAFLNTRGYGYA